MKKQLFLKLILLALLTPISSCSINTAMSGAQALYGRHNLQNSLHDQYITLKAERSIYIDTDRFQDTHVSVATFNNIVLLAGQVSTSLQKYEIEQAIKKIPDIQEIHNLILVSNSASASSLTRMNDSLITAKIRAKLFAANDIDPSQIKVLTENGVVYLMGIVPHDQANVAIEIARTTAGVQSVVKVFYYVRISKV
jgi:osmotically-inducible protein OsmY